ncbi:MAG: PmoA family protein [Opitutaceae bacterium]|nr:PmoA family protein [Opitutaceae bacterium]
MSTPPIPAWVMAPAVRLTVVSLALVTALARPAEAADSRGGVEMVRGEGTIDARIDGQPVFSYVVVPRVEGGHGAEFTRGGYLHPVRSPNGVLVTDAFSHDHPHQTGLFAAWTATRFRGHEVDFWNLGKKLGRVEPAGVERTWSGPAEGGLVARHRYVDLTGAEPVTVLDEWWQVTVHRTEPGDPRIMDIEIRQAPAGDETLELLEYRYGGFTFRGHARWLETRRIDLLTSEGVRDRVQANGTRVRWCAMAGAVDGAVAGLAILGHPSNVRAPQPIRVHPSMPMLNFAPTQLGAFAIVAGSTHLARYRIVVFDGPPDAAMLEAEWQRYAKLPVGKP